MAILPVDILDANSIKLNKKPLIDSNGDLSYNGNIIAKYDQLVSLNMVSSEAEKDLLTPKKGDMCKNTSLGITYIYDTEWVVVGKDNISVFTVSTVAEIEFLQPYQGDLVNVTGSHESYIYTGTEWVVILTGNLIIDDSVVDDNSTWSSTKVDYLIKNHSHDGGTF